jgi:hypothetical protein
MQWSLWWPMAGQAPMCVRSLMLWNICIWTCSACTRVNAFLKLKDAACQVSLVSVSRPSLSWLLPPQQQCFQECNFQHVTPRCVLTSWWPSLHAFSPVFCRNVSLNELKVAEWVESTPESYFVLHVSPPKSATTTLQLELQNLSHVLQEHDNVLTFLLHKNPFHSLQHYTRTATSSWNKHERHRRLLIMQQGTNYDTPWIAWYSGNHFSERFKCIVYSNEVFGIRWAKPTDWSSLAETLASTNMKLIVIITYRRYYEWLLSIKQQVEK